ncbi:phytanoyl-CoA dioxygenase family protein, partial [candidate division KSB1 bacterium]|nr:phytanoyl-CoA dioxygenase family protein [candidate division KSB1 bacterium]
MPSSPHDASSGRVHFETEGYAIFRNVLDADLIGEARRHV